MGKLIVRDQQNANKPDKHGMRMDVNCFSGTKVKTSLEALRGAPAHLPGDPEVTRHLA
jgi:hypothetical protein